MSKYYHRHYVRVAKHDSAWVYALFESHDGTVSYSTLDSPKEANTRDLEVIVPQGQEEEWAHLCEACHGILYTLKSERIDEP
jgi:hypothetical protein